MCKQTKYQRAQKFLHGQLKFADKTQTIISLSLKGQAHEKNIYFVKKLFVHICVFNFMLQNINSVIITFYLPSILCCTVGHDPLIKRKSKDDRFTVSPVNSLQISRINQRMYKNLDCNPIICIFFVPY